MDIRQTPSYAQYLKTIDWKVVHYKKNYFFIKKIPLLGSMIKLQRPDTYSIAEINHIIQRYHPSAFVIEPLKLTEDLLQHGFSQRSPYVPSKTIQISLTKSEESLLSDCSKHTRQAIKKTKTITPFEVKDLSHFRSMWERATNGKRYIPSLKKFTDFVHAFGSECIILMDQEGHAGAMFVASHDTVYYWHGFTDEIGRKKLLQYHILWQGILWGKKHKKKIFDMEGIFDDRFPIKGWQGFSHFKKSFGGEEVVYPGAYIQYFGLMKYVPIF